MVFSDLDCFVRHHIIFSRSLRLVYCVVNIITIVLLIYNAVRHHSKNNPIILVHDKLKLIPDKHYLSKVLILGTQISPNKDPLNRNLINLNRNLITNQFFD